VVRATYGNFSLLLTGDIERQAEHQLVGNLRPVTVLKVAHHGGKTSSSTDFLKAVQPSIAIVSAGRRNSFGHPSAETLGRLEAEGIPVFCTAVFGSIRIETDGLDWSLSHYSAEQQAFQKIDLEMQDWPG
jgi:competence protein ComEC